ncbi:nucleoside triphosphate pyrophosphatase [Cognatiyoonia sp. IB215446]|uniref:Maf family protein n=1 Tax=Cognatiyoonia sp. IB215446 TaxID=3097355 RepID=UPI002A1764B6|nr:nucleoside triphosphate pyrophosphatase [Cognatiyoonia sp. IB215446]MDX8349189.1 nucleoside triphosphate pyrophosphatase [Cognatiyoonia sp. IB215446]
MTDRIILASGSAIRSQLLTNAAVPHEVVPARIDEESVKSSLQAENAPPRDVGDLLAELKAQRVAAKHPDALVIGCDQVLAFDRQILSKPSSENDAISQLQSLRGQTHQLLSAAVIYGEGRPLWRHVGVVRLHMRDLSDTYIADYVARNWDGIQHSVGAYKLEEEGVRFFTRIEGDYFNVLGLPLLELLSYLTLRGTLTS